MEREVASLRSQNKKAKIFMYMVIHDLKHPTESLISSVEKTLNKFYDFKCPLKILESASKKQKNGCRSPLRMDA